MRHLVFFLALVTVLGLVPSPAPPAQEQVPESVREEKSPYVPPGAVKSVEIGNFYFRKRNYRGALSRFEEAVAEDPTYSAAYLGLGKVYEKIGLKQKALEAYRKYLDLLPSERDAENAKAVRRAIGRLEKELKMGGPSNRAARSRSG